MNVKLDENLPHDLAAKLGDHGHDVDTVPDENLAGHDDPTVVATAAAEQRMLLTLDRGVGDIRRYPPGSHAGIVVLRPVSQDPLSLAALLDRFLHAHELTDLSSCVVIVEPTRVRIRRANGEEHR